MRILSPAKINLFLHITGKRENGYHDLITLMCCISLYDTVSLAFGARETRVTCNHPNVPADEENLAHRAAICFFNALKKKEHVAISIDKRIPILNGYGAYTTYDPLAPVARPDLTGWTGPSPLVNEGGTEQKDMVMCLSCHRAHGSPYPDMLRWDYDALVAGKGCYTCHTAKVTGGS